MPDVVPFAAVAVPVRDGTPLTLRPATAADARAFADHVAGDLEHLGEHLGWPEATADEQGAAAYVQRYLDRVDGREALLLLDDGIGVVGGTVLISHDPGIRSVELGCWIARGHEGRGVVRAACLKTIAHARGPLHAHRVAWIAATANVRSRALAERLGFRHEGVLRHAGLHRGRRQDLDVLSMIAGEIDAALRGA